VADELGGGSSQGEGVDAGVRPEAAVFDGDQQVGELRWGTVDAEPPDPARGREQCEDAVLTIEDLCANGGEAGEVGWEVVVQ
jgi:hypothetical protein